MVPLSLAPGSKPGRGEGGGEGRGGRGEGGGERGEGSRNEAVLYSRFQFCLNTGYSVAMLLVLAARTFLWAELHRSYTAQDTLESRHFA